MVLAKKRMELTIRNCVISNFLQRWALERLHNLLSKPEPRGFFSCCQRTTNGLLSSIKKASFWNKLLLFKSDELLSDEDLIVTRLRDLAIRGGPNLFNVANLAGLFVMDPEFQKKNPVKRFKQHVIPTQHIKN